MKIDQRSQKVDLEVPAVSLVRVVEETVRPENVPL
jgi:hypothetical protein